MSKLYIGTSGWSYGNWRGKFYPPEVGRNEWLTFYATQFNTVEINNTFYRLPTQSMVEEWGSQTPEDFSFSVKLSRFITHLKHLRVDSQSKEGLARFFESMAPLGKKCGVILVQLPASLTADMRLLKDFIHEISSHQRNGLPRFAFEFRHGSWFTQEVFQLLRGHNIANVTNDGPSFMATDTTVTADFTYMRFHGKRLYESSYTIPELKPWAERLRGSQDDAFAFFNNTMNLHAIKNARDLRALTEAIKS